MTTGPTAPRLPSIEELNRLPRPELTAALKPLFEAAGPLADALWAQRPFTSYDELLDRAAAIVEELSEPHKIEVINRSPTASRATIAPRTPMRTPSATSTASSTRSTTPTKPASASASSSSSTGAPGPRSSTC
jgi:2-oxo-4-hydroxy-4-carboxy--5-ureidoimidazoline (OHCU) decarboxylase